MNPRIKLVLILMTLCVMGITGLQLFWNYQNYRNTIRSFNHDINEALNSAVEREIAQRHQKVITRFKSWLNDTSLVTISCSDTSRSHETIFHLTDTHPLVPFEKGVSLSINSFTQRLDVITPATKQRFIDRFADTVVREDLKKEIIYFYTQRLGDRLTALHKQLKLNLDSLDILYRQELLNKGIRVSFILNPQKTTNKNPILTQRVNTALNRPYETEMVNAAFPSLSTYFLQQMKWLILTSLLLIGITVFCFVYTIRTLLSQHQLTELKDDFINNMTHELNTPLTSIRITAEALKTFEHDAATQRDYLNIISFQAEKLTGLTGRILENSKLAKQPTTRLERVELRTLLTDVIADLSAIARQTAAIIHYERQPQPVYIPGDKAALQTTFINILENAIKYGGQKAQITISLCASVSQAIVRIADNGPGIPAAYRQQIFNPFFRVPQGRTHEVKGYGLGLSYVRQVIRQHNGTVSVQPNLPRGSIFIIQLPAAAWKK